MGVGDASEPPYGGHDMALPSPVALSLQNSEDLNQISIPLAFRICIGLLLLLLHDRHSTKSWGPSCD